MRGRLMFVIATAVVVLSLPSAHAQQLLGSAQAFGQPPIQFQGQPTYYVWFDQNGWHVRWSTIGPNLFSGQLVTNGQFMSAQGGDRLASWVIPQGERLVFLTGTVGGIAGFDFRTTGDHVTFNLLLNQRAISPHQVVLGSSSTRPSTMPFTVSMGPAYAGRAPGFDPVDERRKY